MFVFIAAIPLVLINTEHDPKDTAWYKMPFIFAGSVFQKGYYGFSEGIRGTTKEYLNLLGIKKEMRLLKTENQELKAQIQRMADIMEENQRLGAMLNFQVRANMKLLGAKVIAHDLSSDHFTITINRGTNHGIKKLQAVISVDGVVGYIFEPQATTSRVLLLTDRSASVDAIVQRTRARGISVGRSIQSCRLRYLERSDDIKEGDLVVTSGLQGFFPKGFPIGRIETVKRTEYGISVEAFLKPTILPTNLEEIFVVLDTGDADLTTPDEEPPAAPEKTETVESEEKKAS